MEIPFAFYQQPYPLDSSATVSFTLDEEQEVSLKIYNNQGQVIQVLYDHTVVTAGFHELKLYGAAFPEGASYARLHTRNGVQQRPLVMNAGSG